MGELSTQERRDLKPMAAVGETEAESLQYLTFTLSGELFAVCTKSVKEIIEYRSLTTVPMVPESIRGVINLRGSVVPVVDLGIRFGGERTEIGRRSCILILEVEEGDVHQVIGVLVDAVNAVLKMPASDIEPAPSFGAKIRTDFVHGMGKLNDDFVIILNVGKVLSGEELALAGEMTSDPVAATE